ncbi:MAG: transposase, family, partial [Bryobacterales bacterium]|nr:transposase, family [Bryobacterales bacterium]
VPIGTVQWTTLEGQIIVVCVRWYLRSGLRLRDLKEAMSERKSARGSGYDLALGSALRAGTARRCRPELRITNRSWRVDETDIGASGKRTRSGGAMLTLLPRRFFQKALRSSAHLGRE